MKQRTKGLSRLLLLLALTTPTWAHVHHEGDAPHDTHKLHKAKHANCGFKHNLVTPGMSPIKDKKLLDDPTKRNMQHSGAGSHPFKVIVDTTNVRITDQYKKDYLINYVVEHGNKIFASKIKTWGQQKIEGNSQIVSSCSYQHIVQVDPQYAYNDVNADFILLLATDNTGNDGTLAYATACYLDSANGRPLVGFTVFNDYYLDIKKGKSDNDIATYVHETLHALVFSSTLWKFFPKVNGKDQYFLSGGNHYLRGPTLVSTAREHFACDKLTAIPLEDDGGDGSKGGHFERVVFGDETMVSEDVAVAKFSKFTLALLKDSGWYDIDMTKGDHYTWGKGEGCELFSKTCTQNSIEETCGTNNNYGCDKTFKYKMTCQATTFTGGCNIKTKSSTCMRKHNGMAFFETANERSRCQEYVYKGKKMSGCVDIQCDNSRTSYQVTLLNQGDSTRYTCHKENQVFTWGNNFKFFCENPRLICNDLCPKSCNHRGRCLENGECWCDPFYSGAVCGTFDGRGKLNQTTSNQIMSANNFGGNNMSNSYSSSDYDSDYLRYTSWAALADNGSASNASINTNNNNNNSSGYNNNNSSGYNNNNNNSSGYSGGSSSSSGITGAITRFLSAGSYPVAVLGVLVGLFIRY